MSWEYKTLDQLGEVSRGRSKHRPRNDPSLFGGEFPFIQTADVKAANFYITQYDTTYNEKGLAQSKLWHPGTLCITIAANIADTGILAIDACFPDSVMGFIPYEGVSDVRFVKYCFDILQQNCKKISQGAAQDNLSWEKLSTILFPAPPIDIQVKIADMLSAYDDLIENNQKQIKLLEEAAQRLYKEWFVDLRFPGHETTPIINGIPEGWIETTIGDETEVKRGGSPRPIQEYLSDEGLNWLKISDATASKSPFIYQIKEKIKPEGLRKTVFLKAGTIILSNSATPGIPKILKIDTCIHDGWLYFPTLQLSNEYMYHLFLQIRSDLISRGTGAVFTNLRTDILKGYKFIKPDDNILDLFNKLVKPIFSEIDCLHQQVLLLTETRDRLLPKLMNGEIEV